MPTYDFHCNKCGEDFTVTVSIKEKTNTTCPKCETKEIKQKFTKCNLGGVSAGGGSASCSGGSCTTCPGCS